MYKKSLGYAPALTSLRQCRIGDGAGACSSRRLSRYSPIRARPAGCSSRYFPYRGIRLPFDNALPPGVCKFNRSAIGSAVAAFEQTHPYLLFRKDGIARIRSLAKKNRKVWARLQAALGDKKHAVPAENLR